MNHVLHEDDRGVDEQADRDRETAQSHRVETDARPLQKEAGKSDRNGNRERDEKSGAQIAEQREQDQDDEERAEQHRAPDSTQRRIDEIGLVVHDPQAHTLRQRLTDLPDGVPDPGRYADRIGAELLDDATADDLAAESMRDPSPNRRGLPDLRHVPEEHRRRAANGDHGVPEVLHGPGTPDGAHRPLHRPLSEDPSRRIDVRPFDGVENVVERDAPGGEPIGVELDLELTQIAAEPLDRGNAGNGEQPVLNLELGQVSEGHQVRRARFGLERELEDLVQPAGQTRNEGRIGSGRQLSRWPG